ncbi:MAG: signal peptidase I [Rubrobacteraceae bacterium]|nr:signal peptidase I [Rubrobacteraceae bacterium]
MKEDRSRWGEDAPKSRRGSRRSRRGKKSGAQRLVEYAVILLVAFVIVFGVLRPFVVKSFWIPSESMVPTLEVGDRIFVNRFVYRFTEPERRDIVVFDGLETDDELVKRVVAVPGDRVRVRNGVLRVNGDFLEEPYAVPPPSPDGSEFGPTRLSEGEVFVMGDNRGNSRDSRFFGPVPLENIQGEAFFRFWPPSRIGFI